jgi:hypothetical protein
MSPILGIYASQISGHLTSYASIATVTVGSGGTSTVTFSSIPSTYTHLQIRLIARSSRASTFDSIDANFNGDSSNANYAQHQITGNGATAASYGYPTSTSGVAGVPAVYTAAASQAANIFGVGVLDILDYTNTNKYKTARSLSGIDANGSGNATLNSGLWLNTSAITSITLISETSSLFTQYSSFALYGIR